MHGHDVGELYVYIQRYTTRLKRKVAHISGPWSVANPQISVLGAKGDWWNSQDIEFIVDCEPVQVKPFYEHILD